MAAFPAMTSLTGGGSLAPASSATSGAQGGDLYGSPLTQNFGKSNIYFNIAFLALAGFAVWRMTRK